MHDSEARAIVAGYLRNCPRQIIKEDADQDIETLEGKSAYFIKRFRECGWLTPQELGYDGTYITTVTRLCRDLIDFLYQCCESDSSEIIGNHIIHMNEILDGIFNPESPRFHLPYTRGLKHLVAEKEGLCNALRSLKNIKEAVCKGKTFCIWDSVLYNGKACWIQSFDGGSAYVVNFMGNYYRPPGKDYKQIPLGQLKPLHHNNNWIVCSAKENIYEKKSM